MLAILPGFRQTFKLTHDFVPYIDIYGGYQQVSLTGNFTQGANPNQAVNGVVNQLTMTTEFGCAYNVSEHLAIIPYFQYIYIGNNPDTVAAAPYSQGGMNISQLTGNENIIGIKLSYAW